MWVKPARYRFSLPHTGDVLASSQRFLAWVFHWKDCQMCLWQRHSTVVLLHKQTISQSGLIAAGHWRFEGCCLERSRQHGYDSGNMPALTYITCCHCILTFHHEWQHVICFHLHLYNPFLIISYLVLFSFWLWQ